VVAMPQKELQIDFFLRGKLDGVEITPATIGLHRFNEFNQQVEAFIAGSDGVKLDDVQVRVGKGSYKLTAILTLLAAASLKPDLVALQRPDSLAEIDPKRAEIVAKWQARSKATPEISYAIRPQGQSLPDIVLNATTDYRPGNLVPWVKVEKYLFGTVMDIGGATKANVHIRLEDSAELVHIGTNQDYLKDQQQNRLYHKVLVRVEAEQHFRTGQLRNLRLLSFEDYSPAYDEAALDRFAEAGRKAWRDVPDAAAWVRKLRGGT
jgi:hypothetical protein